MWHLSVTVRGKGPEPPVSFHCPSFRTFKRPIPMIGRFFRPFPRPATDDSVPPMQTAPDPDSPSDATLRAILKRTKTVAVFGVSSNPVRPSYFVARYLQLKGFRVIPVNPGLAGQTLFRETVYGSLADIPATIPVDMVDIFRRSDAVPGILAEALEHLPKLRTIWMQIGVVHSEAASAARAKGLDVVQDRCPKIEYQRLFGELRMGGFATGVISSKL